MDINAAMTTATGQMIYAMGMTVTYTVQGGNPATITVLFDNPSQSIMLAMGEISSSGPKVSAMTSDVPNAKKGDTFTIGTVGYTVTDVNPDGTGMTEMVLRKT